MSSAPVPAGLDTLLLCYCTGLTIGRLRAACQENRWPLPGMERT